MVYPLGATNSTSHCLAENVPNILTKRDASGLSPVDIIGKHLHALGYQVKSQVLNAADFGVPQLRRRAFIVATATGVEFEFPTATHLPCGKHPDLFRSASPYITVNQALSDLPDLDSGEGTDDPVPYKVTPQNEYQATIRKGSSGVTNHVAMKHSDRLVERFRLIGPGQSLKDAPLSHGQLAKLSGETVLKPFKYNNYRLDGTKPSLAIPASFQSLFLHPAKDRNLTAREAARLMGFPRSFGDG